MNKIIFAALLGGVFTSAAFAVDFNPQQVELKDGTGLVVFEDGKTAMVDQYGHTMKMDQSAVMETKAGTQIAMNGNEVQRLQQFQKQTRAHK
ncbi:CopK family periplasmic copper-binding protein [Paludibacterium purpuratum]|uniref:Copper resistance protein K n=1 Tax=Paludibacterium purpuratum TaxID=1144873 RepID=A0A4R7B276_9NEIS|nr:CopK family periplasmic copper-binding protein [Paludibacterium purpuratum]TDR77828.1 copper resistance protein K [Paludibacterium purpuratum]